MDEQAPQGQVIIKTSMNDKIESWLSVDEFKDKTLLRQCAIEVSAKGMLEITPPITVHGKKHKQPRNVQFFSDKTKHYTYSNSAHKAKPLTEGLKKMLNAINEQYNAGFNGILVNEYKDGTHKIGAHPDNEKELDKTAGVVAISWGASRKFVIRNRHTGAMVHTLETKSGQIIQMGGRFQSEFTHEIPKQLKVKDRRLSFTFRRHQ